MTIFRLPDDISEWGHFIDEAFGLTYGLTLAILIVVMAILVFTLVAHRARPGHRAQFTHGDELVHVLPAAAVAGAVFLGLDLQCERASARAMEALEASYPTGPDAVRIEIRAEQFA